MGIVYHISNTKTIKMNYTSAPVGSNAYNGWVVRIQRGRRYYDPTIDDFREAKYFNPNGPDFDEVIVNDTHIPIVDPY